MNPGSDLESENAYKVFLHAFNFHSATQALIHTFENTYLNTNSGETNAPNENILRYEHLLPYIFVNGAFSCELLLKTLIILNENKSVRGHDLKQLFNRLTESQKEDIGLYLHKLGSFTVISTSYGEKIDSTIVYIEAASQNFVSIRYVFELPESPKFVDTTLLRIALVLTIFDEMPTWENEVKQVWSKLDAQLCLFDIRPDIRELRNQYSKEKQK